MVAVKIHYNMIGNGERKWWNRVSNIIGNNKKSTPNKFYVDNSWQDRETFTENINTYFVKLGGDRKPFEKLKHQVSNYTISIGEVKKQLRKIECSKATHSADFPSFVSRDFAEDVAEPLTDIINAVFLQQTYPAKYKLSEVIPIPKNNSPLTYKDYRPISLLWHCGKIIEHFFLLKLKPQLLPKLINDQFAYQENKSTTDAIIAALDDWSSIIDKKSNAGVEVLFEDFSKAFDMMLPGLLHQALVNMDISPTLIRIADSFLSERMQTVKVGDIVSRIQPCPVGVA